MKWISSKYPSNVAPKVGSRQKRFYDDQFTNLIQYISVHCQLYSPLVVKITGLLVVVMKVFIAARNPVSSSKMMSTSSNKMRDVAVLLPWSSAEILVPVGVPLEHSLLLLSVSFALADFFGHAYKKTLERAQI